MYEKIDTRRYQPEPSVHTPGSQHSSNTIIYHDNTSTQKQSTQECNILESQQCTLLKSLKPI